LFWASVGHMTKVGHGRDIRICNTYAVWALEVYAEQPIDRYARCGYHYDVESYVIYGFHLQYVFGVRR
jgi:hypothetical protein